MIILKVNLRLHLLFYITRLERKQRLQCSTAKHLENSHLNSNGTYKYELGSNIKKSIFYRKLYSNCETIIDLCIRFSGNTPVDLQTQLSTDEGVSGAVSEVGSDILLADPDDDYQPLDPAYLPPGLEDDDNVEKVC